jgi:hypothetical protein
MPTETLQLQAGLFRNPITIQQANSSDRDAFGEPLSGDWTTVLYCRAMIVST